MSEVPNNVAVVKNCILCNKSFDCFAINCWCFSLPPIMLLDEKGDCLCPECLESKTTASNQKNN